MSYSQPECIILIGLPGCGKSTWRAKHLAATTKEYVCISSDDIIDQYAADNGVTYAQAIGVMIKKADKMVQERFRAAVAERKNIILDRTNLFKKSRNRYLSNLPKEYRRTAVVFDLDDAIRVQRVKDREAATGKHIPDVVMADMRKNYEAPTTVDGEFHEIVRIND
jgi:tRNA uridine 5-carbamoylmethylation protein Kti12